MLNNDLEIGQKIIFLDSIDSTNNYIKRNINKLSSGTIVVAEYQTRGRGRGHKKWVSEKSNGLLFSILIKPKFEARNARFFVYLSAVVLTRVLRDQYQVVADIKWPNDVMVNQKKIAGILIDTRYTKGNIKHIVIGIGVNTSGPENQNYSAVYENLSNLTQKNIDKLLFLFKFINDFNAFVKSTNSTNSFLSKIINEWNFYCNQLNKVIEITLKNNKFHYMFKGLNAAGEPMVETAQGSRVLHHYEDIM